MNTKKLFVITAIIFFPITILFSPLIILLYDIRSRLQIINSLSEQILIGNKVSAKSTHRDPSINRLINIIEDVVLTKNAKLKKRL